MASLSKGLQLYLLYQRSDLSRILWDLCFSLLGSGHRVYLCLMTFVSLPYWLAQN